MQSIDIFFYIFASLAALFALRVVTARNPITGAFSLILVLFCLAASFALMEAHFIAAIQVLVYAGAVMVLFVFVIMLLNADIKNSDFGKSPIFQVSAGVLSVVVLALFVWCIEHGELSTTRGGLTVEKIQELGGNVRVISETMFADYILPFELTSVLLLVGIVGSVALAKRAKARTKNLSATR